MPKIRSRKVLRNLLLLIALKWTLVGVVTAVGMLSMKSTPMEFSLYSFFE